MLADELMEIKRRERSATPGPWKIAQDHDKLGQSHGDVMVVSSVDGEWIAFASGHEASGISVEPEDADFIASARTDIPSLLMEVDRLRAQRAELVLAFRWTFDVLGGYAGLQAVRGYPPSQEAIQRSNEVKAVLEQAEEEVRSDG